MMRLFVDTSAWAALADASDDQHNAALIYQKELTKRRLRHHNELRS